MALSKLQWGILIAGGLGLLAMAAGGGGKEDVKAGSTSAATTGGLLTPTEAARLQGQIAEGGDVWIEKTDAVVDMTDEQVDAADKELLQILLGEYRQAVSNMHQEFGPYMVQTEGSRSVFEYA